MGAKVFLMHSKMGTFWKFVSKFPKSTDFPAHLNHLRLELPLLDLRYMIDNTPKNMVKIILGRMQTDAGIFFASEI